MNLAAGAHSLTTNEQQLNMFMPGSQDLRAHRGVTRNRHTGQSEPSAIYSKPSNAGSLFSPSLFATPMQDDLISTGFLANPYTGQEYELFENQLPPGDTDRSIPKSQLQHINPRLLHMQGGYNHHKPPPSRKEQDGSVFSPVSINSGGNVFGPQLYTKAINDRQKDMIIRSTFNNRHGDQVIEPEFAKERPANYFGYVPVAHFNPYVPPTNEPNGYYVPPHEVIGVDTRKREQYTGAMFNNKPRVHVKDRVFPHNGPEMPNPPQDSDLLETQRDGTFALTAGPHMPVGMRQDTTWVLRPTQTHCALPIGMVTGVPLPATRITEVRGTSQAALPMLPPGALTTLLNAPPTQATHNPSLRMPSVSLPQGAVTGTQAPASVPITSSRPGPQTIGSLPVGPLTAPQAAVVVPTTTMRQGPQGVGTLPPGLPDMASAPAAVPSETMRQAPLGVGALPPGLPDMASAPAVVPSETMRQAPLGVGALPPGLPDMASAPAAVPSETMRDGPLGVGSLPVGLPTVQHFAPASIPTETMRAGPQTIGSLPVGLPSGTIAPAMVPTTMTVLAFRPGMLPVTIPTGIHAARLTTANKEPSLTRRPQVPLPAGQVVAEALGGNIGTTMKMRDLNQRERLFGASHTANPTLDGAGELVHPSMAPPLAWRGEHESEYQIGEFSGIVDGSSIGMRPPEPQNIRVRKTEPFTPHVGGHDFQNGKLMEPQMSTVNERTLREACIAQQMEDDV